MLIHHKKCNILKFITTPTSINVFSLRQTPN